MNLIQEKLFLNEVVERIKQKEEYIGHIHTRNKVHTSAIADVVYEKCYDMPGLSKEDYKKIIMAMSTYIWPEESSPSPSQNYLQYSVLPGEGFVSYAVKMFVKNKSNFKSLSVGGKKLFSHLRKEVLKRRLNEYNNTIQAKTKQLQSITKELQGLEENLK